MKAFAIQEAVLGTLITLQVAAYFAWLSAFAIALRSLALQRVVRR
jgi:hypothetical protein